MECGISIHIGVNRPAKRLPSLSKSEDAAWGMAELARQAGYRAIHVLCGAAATRDAVGAQLAAAACAIRPGQTLFVTFSGHGSKVRDLDKDEGDGWDETWCLHDGDLVDDALAGYWRLLARDTRVLVVAESCYASVRHGAAAMVGFEARKHAAYTRPVVYRSADPGSWRSVKQFAEPQSSCIARTPLSDNGIRASLLMLAAVNEAREATEGVYTRHLLDLWDGGAYRGSYCELHQELSARVKGEVSRQDPQILMLGTPDAGFPLESAFHLEPREQRPMMRGTRGGS